MIRNFVSRNPFTNKILKEFDFISSKELNQKLEQIKIGHQALVSSYDKLLRIKLTNLASLLEIHKNKYAELISAEMGKPIAQSLMEVAKTKSHCLYYSKNKEKLLGIELISTDAKKSYVSYEPLGGVYVIVPFNFPLWLAFKSIIPIILSGNAVLVRSSDSTPLMGLAIEEMFQAAGFESFEYQNVFSSPNQLEHIMSHSSISAVEFCGSSKAGSQIAMIAGKYLKKSVLKLGGLDPFIVLSDADASFAADLAVKSRTNNAGQACHAGKRFIVHENIYDKFKEELIVRLANIECGDPMENSTKMGPLARVDLIEKLSKIVDESLKQGGKLVFQKDLKDLNNENFFGPTVLEVDRKNILFQEETLGPLFPLLKFKTEDEAIEIANDTCYGLSAVIVSKDEERGEEVANQIKAGMVFVNEIVKTDSRYSSGGIKNSGYGRECGKFGIKEFSNIKTTYIMNAPLPKTKKKIIS